MSLKSECDRKSTESTNNKATDTVSINGYLILDKVRECTALMFYEPTLSQPSISMLMDGLNFIPLLSKTPITHCAFQCQISASNP